MNQRVVIYAHLRSEDAERVWRWLYARDLLAGVYTTAEEILWAEGEKAVKNVDRALEELNLQPTGETTLNFTGS